MAKETSGQYFKDPQMSNNLFQMGLAYPSIYNMLTYQDVKYNLDYVTHALSDVAELPLGQNKHEWFVQGRSEDILTCTGVSSGTGVNNTVFYVEYYDNSSNPKNVVRFKSGVQAHILDGGTQTANGFTYAHRVASFSTSTAIVASDVAVGQDVGRAWTTFEEKSKTGFGGFKYPDKYANWTSISRWAASLSGSDLTDITWIGTKENPHIVWYPTQYKIERDIFKWMQEKKLRYAKSNIDPLTGICKSPDLEGNMLPQGDGYIEQISGINEDTYTGQLQPAQLLDYIYAYIDNACLVKGDQVMVDMGTQGAKMWQNCLELKYLTNPVLRQEMMGGKDVKLGNMYPSYTVANVELLVNVDPIKDDKQFFVDLDSDGFTKESKTFDFTLVQGVDGTKNLQKMVKSAGTVNRGFIERQIGGMVNPYSNGTVTQNSEDSFEVQWLSDEMLIVRNPKACGRLIKV